MFVEEKPIDICFLRIFSDLSRTNVIVTRRSDHQMSGPEDPNIAIFGEKARPLPQDGKLPTIKDTDLAVEYQLENTQAGYRDQQKSAVKAVAEEVESLWVKLVPKVPIKVRKNIVQSVSSLRVKRDLFLRSRLRLKTT